jgi:hypothetical protein
MKSILITMLTAGMVCLSGCAAPVDTEQPEQPEQAEQADDSATESSEYAKTGANVCLALGLYSPPNPLVTPLHSWATQQKCLSFERFEGSNVSAVETGAGTEWCRNAIGSTRSTVGALVCGSMIVAKVIKFNIAGLINAKDFTYLLTGAARPPANAIAVATGSGLARAMKDGANLGPVAKNITNWEFFSGGPKCCLLEQGQVLH